MSGFVWVSHISESDMAETDELNDVSQALHGSGADGDADKADPSQAEPEPLAPTLALALALTPALALAPTLTLTLTRRAPPPTPHATPPQSRSGARITAHQATGTSACEYSSYYCTMSPGPSLGE